MGRGRRADRETDRDSPRSRSPSKGGKQSKQERREERERKKQTGARGTQSPDTDSSEAPADARASARHTALALPAEDSVLTADFVNNLATNIGELMISVRDLAKGMKEVQQEQKDQRSHIAGILTEMQTMRADISAGNERHQKEMAELNSEIEAKLASLRAAPTTPKPPLTSASSSSYGPGGPPAAPPPSSGAGGFRPTRIWLKGFKEVLTTKFLNDFAKKAVARLPPDMQVGAKTGAPGFGAAVYIDYPSTTRVAPIRLALQEMDLKHTDEQGVEQSLRVHPDIPLAIRHRGRVLGELWKFAEPHMENLDSKHRPKEIKLGNSNGRLFLILSHRPVELFATKTDDQGTLHVVPNLANLHKYKVDEAMAQSWVTSACASASRGGQ
jgi:hypothetical protein